MDKKENEKPGIKEKNKDVGIKEKEQNKGLIHEQKKPELKAAENNIGNRDTQKARSDNKVSLHKADIKENVSSSTAHEQKAIKTKTAEANASTTNTNDPKAVTAYDKESQIDNTYDPNAGRDDKKTKHYSKAANSDKTNKIKRKKDKNEIAGNATIKKFDLETKIKVLQDEIDVLEQENSNLRAKIDDIDYQLNDLNNQRSIINADPNADISELDNIRQQEDKLLGERFELSEKYWENNDKIDKAYVECNEITRELSEIQNDVTITDEIKPKNGDKRLKNIAKSVVAAPVSFAVNTVKSTLKDVAAKANPLDQKINVNDVSDTGTEAMRLAYTGVKKGINTIKTADRTIKTTKNTIKTTKTVVKGTGTAIYKTAEFAGKTVITTFKVTEFIFTHIAAALLNPIVVVILLFLIVTLLCYSIVITMLGGAAASTSANQQAMTNAVGLENAAEQYQNGQTYFDNAIGSIRDGYNSIIDGLYYDEDDRVNSDLIYVKRYFSDEEDIAWVGADYGNYGSFAYDYWKETLKEDVWEMQISYSEAAAIAYVYLEKQSGGGNANGFYNVTFTQDVFDTIAAECAYCSDNIDYNQLCPDEECAYTDEDDWHCDSHHTLHNVGLWFYNKSDVMDALGFNEQEKQWVVMTEQGFANNPNIP